MLPNVRGGFGVPVIGRSLTRSSAPSTPLNLEPQRVSHNRETFFVAVNGGNVAQPYTPEGPSTQ